MSSQEDSATYSFLPWVRQGLARAIGVEDTLGSDLPSRVALDVLVDLDDAGETATATTRVRLIGPGDVTGFDQRVVIRTDPAHLAMNVEPNYFPIIEFDQPDFPWLFMPAAANAQERLRPWICLVVVEKTEDCLLPAGADRPLPVLKVNPSQLPDLDESWAWAHAQLSGSVNNDPGKALAGAPELNLSRLICPRYLGEKRNYYACVVPAFKAGCQAGLADPAREDAAKQTITATLEPAWDLKKQGDVQLPVYYYWEFSTGLAGDFEELAGRLKRPDTDLASLGVGKRDMQVGEPVKLGDSIGLEGALHVTATVMTEPGYALYEHKVFAQAMLERLAPDAPLPDNCPVKPPIYGRWHGARSRIPEDSSERPWLHDLNLDPRWRVAAGIGTLVVQDQQEQLMASAWQQLGEITRANQLLRQAQLARAAGKALYQGQLVSIKPEKKPNPTPKEQEEARRKAAELFTLTAPLHSRIRGQTGTIHAEAHFTNSRLPAAVASAAFRRMTRPRGPLARHAQAPVSWTGQLIHRLNEGAIEIVPSGRGPSDMGTIDLPTQIAIEGVQETPDNAAFRAAVIKHYALLREPEVQDLSSCNLVTLSEIIWITVDPDTTVENRWLGPGGRIMAPAEWQPEDKLEPIMAAPEFPTPMYRALRDISQDLMLPGLEHVPANTIAVLYPNPRFIEAYMAGLNHEMSRELLWRGFPTDQRGTYFRQFWNPDGQFPPTKDAGAASDITPLTEWRNHPLGANYSGGEGQIILLIRGDLLVRYPRAMIYLAKAEEVHDDKGNLVRRPRDLPENFDPEKYSEYERHPVFQGTLPPDITFLGFAISNDELVKDAGWFFVIQQPPTEPRFGLDASTSGQSSKKECLWSDLAWGNVLTSDAEGRLPTDYIRLADKLKNFPPVEGQSINPPDLHWDVGKTTSAQLAAITLQGPFRVAIHASQILPPEEVRA